MKPIAFEYQLAREEWLAGLMVVLARMSANDPYRPWMNITRLVGFLILTAIWTAAHWNLWSLFAAALLLPLGEALIQRTIGRRAIGSTFDPGESETWLEISDDGLKERTRNRERRFVWSGVRGTYETGDAIVFDLVGTDFMVLPLRVVDEAKRAQLEAGAAEFERPIQGRSQADARAGLRLTEVAVIAKLCVAVATLGAAVNAVTSGPFITSVDPDHPLRAILIGFAGGIVAAVVGWFACGALLRSVTRRAGESAASIASWALIIGSLAFFFLGFSHI